MRRPKHGVIPGRRAAASPESITTGLSAQIQTREFGFRAPAFGRPRNDALRIGARDVTYDEERHLCAQRHQWISAGPISERTSDDIYEIRVIYVSSVADTTQH